VSHRFEVWAPHASRVEVVFDGDARWPLASVGEGWWADLVDRAGPGADYRFSVDGGPPRPDPRSPWQPHGVDGPSRLVDHGAFKWSDGSWRGVHLPGAVLYELHVGTFSPGGTFDAAIDHLDHLVDLGIDAVELLPVAEFSGSRGWGYDGVDLYAPHHAYGGPDGLKRLVDACHCRGLAVVMDVVYNHLGPSGNYLAQFGPYFTARHSTNWGDAVNFDGPDSGGVRAFVIDNALMWLRDYHADGLRLDAVHAIEDHSARHVLEELGAAVHRLAAQVRRPLFVIAESDLNDPRFVRSPDAGGYGLDAVWADEFHHALRAVLTGERDGYYADFGTLALLARAVSQAWVYAGDYSPYRRRVHGRPPTGLGGERFVVFLQNHDQIGNRAIGDRITGQVSWARAKVGAALVLLAPFLPMVFQGEEWAAGTPFLYFTDHQDRALGEAVSEGRRREFSSFGWSPEQVPDPQDPATFERSKLDWDELASEPHRSMFEWYQRLIRLRREIPDLAGGDRHQVSSTFDEGQGWLVVGRGRTAIAVNLGPEPVILPLAPCAELLAASGPGVAVDGGDGYAAAAAGKVHLPPDSVAVLRIG
jgi:maltooligosyltrehalose trehalohydrolase